MKGSHNANCKVHESQRKENLPEHTWPKCRFPKSGASRSSKTCLGPQSAVMFMPFRLQDKKKAWTLLWCGKKQKKQHLFAHLCIWQEYDILCWWRLYCWNSTCTRTVNSPVGVLLGSWTETHPRYASIPKSWQWITPHKSSTALDVYFHED